jgi:hypothetical protein
VVEPNPLIVKNGADDFCHRPVQRLIRPYGPPPDGY